MDDFRIYQRGLNADEVRELATVDLERDRRGGRNRAADALFDARCSGELRRVQPGVAKESTTATTTANVASTAGDATLSSRRTRSI